MEKKVRWSKPYTVVVVFDQGKVPPAQTWLGVQCIVMQMARSFSGNQELARKYKGWGNMATKANDRNKTKLCHRILSLWTSEFPYIRNNCDSCCPGIRKGAQCASPLPCPACHSHKRPASWLWCDILTTSASCWCRTSTLHCNWRRRDMCHYFLPGVWVLLWERPTWSDWGRACPAPKFSHICPWLSDSWDGLLIEICWRNKALGWLSGQRARS